MQIKKYPHKNLNKNRMIYFQVGLCLVLIFLLVSVEWKSYTQPLEKDQVKYKEVVFEEMIEVKLPEKKPEFTPVSKPKKYAKPTKSNEDLELKEELVKKQLKVEFNPDAIFKELKSPEEDPIENVSWVKIEDVPIFPGCEVYKDNDERRSCMQKKLSKFIGKHFNTRLAIDLGLQGKHVIYTQFKIKHTGEVIFMGGQNPNPELVAEAKRVIDKLPNMIPGKQRDKAVNVIFGLPINFEVLE
jgi:protein TonB